MLRETASRKLDRTRPGPAAPKEAPEAELSLIGDAVVLMKKEVTESVIPVGWPPLKELFQALVQHQVPIYV